MVGSARIASGILVDMLNDFISLKGSTADKECVLKVNLILLVIVLIGKLYESEYIELADSVGIVLNDSAPYFVGLILGNIISRLGCDTCVSGSHYGIACAVSGRGFVEIKRLGNRLPGARPVVSALLITDIDIDDGSWKAVESRKVEPVCIGRDHNDDRLLKNAAAFSDCEYMLVAKIGMSAANAVESFGVQVFEMPMLIPDAIDKMRRYVQVQNLFL